MKVLITEKDIIDLSLARGINLRSDKIYVYYGKEDVLTYEFLSEEEAEIVFENISKITATESIGALATPKKRVARKIIEDIPLDKKATEMFDKFWDAYDKKISKTEAKRSWAYMDEDEREAAIVRGKKYREGYGNDIRYMKNASTWLNQRCWEDVVIPRDVSTIISKEDKKASQPKYNKPKYIKDDR